MNGYAVSGLIIWALFVLLMLGACLFTGTKFASSLVWSGFAIFSFPVAGTVSWLLGKAFLVLAEFFLAAPAEVWKWLVGG